MPLYSDVNSITPKDVALLLDVEAIYQSLFNILLTRKGEVPYFPEEGIEIENELFELMEDAAALRIYSNVIDAVERNEPRVEINSDRTKVTPIPDIHEFDLVLAFDIPGFDLQNLELVHRFAETT